MNMFKTITSVLTNQSVSDDEIRQISSYLFCKWLSGNKITVYASNEINKYYNIPIECQYKMIKCAFNGKVKFIKYPSSDKEESIENIEIIQKHFKLSYDKAKEYLLLISKDELEHIKNLYKNI